jgi:hypothetical protein
VVVDVVLKSKKRQLVVKIREKEQKKHIPRAQTMVSTVVWASCHLYVARLDVEVVRMEVWLWLWLWWTRRVSNM